MTNTAHSPANMRLEVEVPTSGLPNLVQNPSGAKGAWGWVTPVDNTKISRAFGSTPSLEFSSYVTQACYFTSDFLPVAAGRYVAARLEATSTAGNTIRARFEWYDSAKTLLSSSTQSSAWAPPLTGWTSANTFYLSSVQAPASTAYVKLRVDYYASNGSSNPAAYSSLYFRNAMVTHAASSGAIGTTRSNLILNPSFETGVGRWPYTEKVASVLHQTDGGHFGNGYARLLVGPANDLGNGVYFQTLEADISASAGEDYIFSAYMRSSYARTAFLSLHWIGADGRQFAVSTGGQDVINQAYFGRHVVTGTAPSGAVYVVCRVNVPAAQYGETYDVDATLLERGYVLLDYFDGSTTDAGGITYDWSGTAHDSASTATTGSTSYPFVEPGDWRNVLNEASEIGIERQGLDVGVLKATIRDAMLDPAVEEEIRPGAKVRLRVLVDGKWESAFEGKAAAADVHYEKAKTLGAQTKARIELTATDPLTELANQGESRGVESIEELPYLLEDKGVPWNINGSGNQVDGLAGWVNLNENASMVDQIAITRDSHLGYAWVDRNGVLNAYDADAMPDWLPININGTFETGITGWSATNATLSQSTTAHSGTKSLNVDATASGNVIVRTPTGTSGFPVSPGSKISISAWLRRTSGTNRTASVRLQWYTEDGSDWGYASSTTKSVTSTWQEWVRTDAVVPSEARFLTVWIQFDSAVSTDNFLIDDVVVTEPPVLRVSDASDGDVSYSDIDATFSTGDCINTVTVKWLRYDYSTGETEEIPYGPYVDVDSVAEWGPRKAEFTIGGASEVEADIIAYAAAILAANAVPQRKVNSLRIPVKTAEDIDNVALLDLYNNVLVTYGDLYVEAQYRITGIKHTITPDGWFTDLSFSTTTQVAAPTWTPSPPSRTENEWMTYTPTVTNVGTVTKEFRWTQIGKTVTVRGRLQISGNPSGNVSVSLPVPANLAWEPTWSPAGQVVGLRQGSHFLDGWVFVTASGTTVQMTVTGTGGQVFGQNWPIVWANTDFWWLQFTYERA